MKGKRFLGIPVSIIAIVLTIMLVGASAAYAAILFTKEMPATVKVITPWELSAWQDQACTQPLASVDFGKISKDTKVDADVFYIRNDGTDPSYTGFSQSGLAGKHLQLTGQGFDGYCPTDAYTYPAASGVQTPLASDAVRAITLQLKADSSVTNGVVDFTVIIKAADTPYVNP